MAQLDTVRMMGYLQWKEHVRAVRVAFGALSLWYSGQAPGEVTAL
jgi:hypothetical protein